MRLLLDCWRLKTELDTGSADTLQNPHSVSDFSRFGALMFYEQNFGNGTG